MRVLAKVLRFRTPLSLTRIWPFFPPPACGRGRGWVSGDRPLAPLVLQAEPTPNPSRRREGDQLSRPFWLYAALLLAAPAHADVLVDNVDGLTLTADGRVERFSGVLVDDNGRVQQLFQRGDKRPARVDYRLDGKNRVLMPGLIDAHVELMKLGIAAVTLNLSGTRSLAEAQARIAAYAAAHPDLPWIMGYGWNQEQWGLARYPTAAEIDAVVRNRSVWLTRADGHAGWANSAALAAAGIAATSKDPVGGRIERIAGTARPAGVLMGSAAGMVERKLPPPRPEDLDKALADVQQKLLERGITAVTDMGTTIEAWQAYRRAGDLGTLRLRILAYAQGTEAMALIGGPGPSPWLYEDRLRLNGVILHLDGGLGSRGAALKAPYADQPGSTGFNLITDTQLKNLMSRAAIDRFQVAVAATGDKAVATLLDAIEDQAPTYQGDRRWRIEHAELVDPADFARFARNGLAVSMQPQALVSGLGVAEARLGALRLAGAYAWKSLSAAGARLAFGSGAPSGPLEPFAGMAAATTRQGANAQPFGGWQPQERLTREAALAAYTTGAAWAGFADGRLGRIAIGQRADFLLVDRDPLLATSDDLRAMRVLQTWVGGKLVWQAKEMGASGAR